MPQGGQEVGDEFTADAVVPTLRLGGGGAAPHVADLLHVVLVVHVEVGKHVLDLL